MKKKTLVLVYLFICFHFTIKAQASFKVMFYNLLKYPTENTFSNRETDLQLILSDYQPDLFLVCELNNQAGANTILNLTKSVINANFEMATYVSNTSDDSSSDANELQNLLYYDSSKFSLESQTIIPTNIRDFNSYKLKLNTINQATNPIEIYLIVCHLKSSSGTSNEIKRLEMVQELDAYLNTLPANANVLLGGDLNLYSATESAFQELLDSSNHITFTDPANRIGNWNNNSSFIDVFTQSTRTQSGLGGASGGFDSRFDFILTSENMLTTADITYKANSYKVYGNNNVSSCYNRSINSSDCAGSNYSSTIRNALYNFSDHLPVTVTLETSATLLSIDENEIINHLLLEETIVRNTLNINTKILNSKNNTFIIYDNLGHIVKSFSVNNNTKQSINISELSDGLYYLTTLKLNTTHITFIKIN